MLHAFSMNTEYHCTAVRKEHKQWKLCDDEKVKTLPSEIVRKVIAQPDHHLLCVYKRKEGAIRQ